MHVHPPTRTRLHHRRPYTSPTNKLCSMARLFFRLRSRLVGIMLCSVKHVASWSSSHTEADHAGLHWTHWIIRCRLLSALSHDPDYIRLLWQCRDDACWWLCRLVESVDLPGSTVVCPVPDTSVEAGAVASGERGALHFLPVPAWWVLLGVRDGG